MSNIEPLDNVRHAGLHVMTGHGAAHGDAVNQAPLFVTEFAEAQRQYPILFRKNDAGNLTALAILGFERDENLFLGDGTWQGYVPAIIRRGPFLIGQGQDEQPLMAVDLDHPRVRRDGDEGAPLFLEHGGHAPALEAAGQALQQIHAGTAAASQMQEIFEELELVEPLNLKVQISDSQAVNFEGFLAVSDERIAALDGAQLERLNEAGMLMPAVHAATSLGNLARLVARKQQRDRASGTQQG